MSEPIHVRVSDEERERVAGELRERFAQGRLDTDELEELILDAWRCQAPRALVELGRRKVVVGQEDAIIGIAAELAEAAGRTP